MGAKYEFWLCNDGGQRITSLSDAVFASYSRAAIGYGVIQVGVPYENYKLRVPDIFHRDWRIDVWRSPEDGFPMRRECSFFLRRFDIYQREDGMKIIELYGRSPIDVLRRGAVVNDTDPDAYFKTEPIDDMMKSVVQETIVFVDDVTGVRLGYTPWTRGMNSPTASGIIDTGEFYVDAKLALGPEVVKSFLGSITLDILNELRDTSIVKNKISGTEKIYFDVIEDDSLAYFPGGFGYLFKTYAGLRGMDRTGSQLVFSPDNGNFVNVRYYEDYLEEINKATTPDSGGNRIANVVSEQSASRWNWNCIATVSYVSDSTDPVEADADEQAYLQAFIKENDKTERQIDGTFLNTPGGPGQPRSLYGVDWDLGDLVRVQFAGKTQNVEIMIVYVSLDENGAEKVTGRTKIGA